MTQTHDPELAALVAAAGLECPAGLDAWEERLRTRLDSEVYAEYLEYRMGYAAGSGPDLNSAFYDFIGRHADLAFLMQEGRLGYHAAALPDVVAGVAAAGKPDAILDLGCNCGLTTLYLARRFPGSRVVGIDRAAGLVEAARLLQARSGVQNAEFVCGDYARHSFERPFDAVVSLQTMPAFFLPFLPSEQPESYHRGENLLALAADPVLPHRCVGRCLTAVRGLLSTRGRAVLHERLANPAQVLLFALLAAKAGLRAVAMSFITWESASEVNLGRHTNPLIVAEPRKAPDEFSEERVLDLYLAPTAPLPAPPAPGSNRMAVVTGPLAQRAFQAAAPGRRVVRLRAEMRDGRWRHCHLGLDPGKVAFSYSCDTFDGRELKLADVLLAARFFTAEAEAIGRGLRSGDITSLEPRWEALPPLIDSLGRP